jgi:hypothetical protein
MSQDLQNKYPSYYVTRHMTDFMNTGTRVVHSISSDPEILPISGIHPDGSKVLQIINLKKEPVTIEVQGFDSGTIDQYTTTEAENWYFAKNIAKTRDGIVLLKLKSQSVNSFIFK